VHPTQILGYSNDVSDLQQAERGLLGSCWVARDLSSQHNVLDTAKQASEIPQGPGKDERKTLSATASPGNIMPGSETTLGRCSKIQGRRSASTA
jgi:hypothetical protein